MTGDGKCAASRCFLVNASTKRIAYANSATCDIGAYSVMDPIDEKINPRPVLRLCCHSPQETATEDTRTPFRSLLNS